MRTALVLWIFVFTLGCSKKDVDPVFTAEEYGGTTWFDSDLIARDHGDVIILSPEGSKDLKLYIESREEGTYSMGGSYRSALTFTDEYSTNDRGGGAGYIEITKLNGGRISGKFDCNPIHNRTRKGTLISGEFRDIELEKEERYTKGFLGGITDKQIWMYGLKSNTVQYDKSIEWSMFNGRGDNIKLKIRKAQFQVGEYPFTSTWIEGDNNTYPMIKYRDINGKEGIEVVQGKIVIEEVLEGGARIRGKLNAYLKPQIALDVIELKQMTFDIWE